MKAKVYTQEGKEVGQALLPKEVFDLKVNPDLVHQVVLAQMANRRKVIAKAKDRSEVRGGGRKPWRQKGTGRARHGSRRSPIWKGGGVTFGPTGRESFKKKINKKMRRKALLMVLSAKAKNNLLLILDKIIIPKSKTKLMADILKKLPLKGSCLIALPHPEVSLIRATKNLAGAETVEVKNLNALDVLSAKHLILPRESIKMIKDIFLK